MPLVSALPFSLAISARGDTLSKFRSKTISAGFVLAFSSTSLPSFTNSSARPLRLAASLSLTEKNRSLTTARTRLGSCFSINVSFSRVTSCRRPNEGLGDVRILTRNLLAGRRRWLVESIVSRIVVRPVIQIQAHPAAGARPVARVAKQIRQTARAARPRRVVVQRRLALRLHAGEDLRRPVRLHARRRVD